MDALAFGHGLLGLRWLNYAFVWLALQGMGSEAFPWIRIAPLVLALGGAAVALLSRGRESVN